MQDIFLITWKSHSQAARQRDPGREGRVCSADKRKGGKRRAGQVSAFHLDIQDDTSGAREAALAFLTDGKLCSQGRAELSGELGIKSYPDSSVAREGRREVRCDCNQRWVK